MTVVESTPVHDPLGVPGVRFAERRMEVAGGARLRLLDWQPGTETTVGAPILFVAGWVSVVEGWADLLRALVPRHPVYYLETREKGSAELPKTLQPADLSIEQAARDIIAAAQSLNLPERGYFAIGSSLGATALLEAMKQDRLTPKATFLIGPNASFRFPRWGLLVLGLPAFLYHVIKYFILWYLRTFKVDVKREPEQMRRYEQTLLSAVPKRIKLSAIAVRDYTVWPQLDTVTCPIAIAHAKSDKLHAADDVAHLLEKLPRVQDVPCPSNLHMHSRALMAELDPFFQKHR